MKGASVAGLSVLVLLAILIGLPKRKQMQNHVEFVVDTTAYENVPPARYDTLEISSDTLTSFLDAIAIGKGFLKRYVERGDTGNFLKYGFCREFDDFRQQQKNDNYYVTIRAFQYPGTVDEWLYCSINTYRQIHCFIARAAGSNLDILLEWSDTGMPTHRGGAVVRDVNSDGYPDIIVSYGNQPLNQDLTHVRIALGTSSGYKLVPLVISPHFNIRSGRIYCKGGWSIHTSWVEAYRWQGDTLLPEYSVSESHSVKGTKIELIELFDSSGTQIFKAVGEYANRQNIDSLIPNYADRLNSIPHWDLLTP